MNWVPKAKLHCYCNAALIQMALMVTAVITERLFCVLYIKYQPFHFPQSLSNLRWDDAAKQGDRNSQRPGWMGPQPAWSGAWQPCPQQGFQTGWTLRSFHTQVILWFYEIYELHLGADYRNRLYLYSSEKNRFWYIFKMNFASLEWVVTIKTNFYYKCLFSFLL